MNENYHITIRPRKDKQWVMKEVEKVAEQQDRSISYIIIDILEKHFNSKPKNRKK